MLTLHQLREYINLRRAELARMEQSEQIEGRLLELLTLEEFVMNAVLRDSKH